jgi:uncharacterized protein YcbK (DUF882 family)
MTVSRRQFITSTGAATLVGMIPANAIAAETRLDILKPAIIPYVRMHNVHTGEKISSTFYWDGQYDQNELRRLDWFLRDWREDVYVEMSRNLFWAAAALGQAAQQDGHSGEIDVLSGYRTKKTNNMLRRKGHKAAKDSRHLKGQAIDLTMAGVSVSALYSYVRWMDFGGAGHYPRNNFIHMDTGPKRSWIG